MQERRITKKTAILIAVGILALVLLAVNYEPGCGESNFCGTPGGEGTLSGYVHIGPVCPVVMQGSEEECADRPYSVSIEIHYQSEKLHSVIKSDEAGRFSMSLPANEYILRPQVANVLPACNEERVVVSPDSNTSVDISCDSGIR